MAISFKVVGFWLACAMAWIVVLPLFLSIGMAGLLAYAVFTEINDRLFGQSHPTPDHSAAREMARRVCLGL